MSKKIGIVGTGMRGIWSLAREIEETRGRAELISLCDRNSMRLKAAADMVEKEVSTFTDYEEFLKMDALDAVVVSTPDYTHHELSVFALKHGKHIFVEKPMALRVNECQEMIDEARKRNLVIQVGFKKRYIQFYRKIKEFLDKGVVGEPVMMHSFDYQYKGHEYFRRWHRHRDKSGGLLVHKGCHDIDLTNWYLDDSPLRVAAVGGLNYYLPRDEGSDRCLTCAYKNRCGEYLDLETYHEGGYKELYLKAEKEDGYIRDVCVFNSEKDVEDNATLIVEYKDNKRASHTECHFASGYTTTRIVIIGTAGTLEADSKSEKICIRNRHGSGETEYSVPHKLLNQMQDFLDSIEKGIEPFAGGEEGRDSVAVGVGAELSIREKRMVSIEEVSRNVC